MLPDYNTPRDNTFVAVWGCYAAVDAAIAVAAVAEDAVGVAVVAMDVGESPPEQLAGCAKTMRPTPWQRCRQCSPGFVAPIAVIHPPRQILLVTKETDHRVVSAL